MEFIGVIFDLLTCVLTFFRCGHCKKLAPEFEKAATTLKENDPPVGLAEIDCDGAGKETCSKYKIQGFPTLKIFKDGVESADYKGQRSSDGIVKYMRGKAGPSSKELKTAAEFEKFTGSSEYVILGLFSAEDSALAKDFQKLADAMNEDYRFAHSYSKEVHAKSKYENNVVIYQPKQLHNKVASYWHF
ncbi:hypothetical protein NP493_4256g00003 [Ridgeia piscesae]|uniref:protein disulfide-isomerase n=1 Tax=Ridgeia piscesae TaxID=27915 RepID=A0AAD9MSZ3_RIDPI|nr:hypothetical protein NP493_4256g00003 [Ridgeia piscesae]